MKRAVFILFVLFIAGGGWYFWDSRDFDDHELMLSGNVDIREVNLSFRIDGRVSDVLVEEGDRVAQGDVIAMIDPEPLEAKLAQAQASLAAMEAGEALLRAGARVEEIARLKAQMQALRVASTNAETTYRRQRTT